MAIAQRSIFRSTNYCFRSRKTPKPFRCTSKISCSANPEPDVKDAPSSAVDIERELSKFTRQTAATFAPRSSTAIKNPAYRGSNLYWIFEGQAWACMAVGGLLSFNILFPTEEPSIPRLLGMWSIWMLTIPSLRAKECMPKEKECLNYLFLLIPLVNITLPFVWKSFPFIFTADVLVLLGVYAWKGVWQELYVPMLAGELPPSSLLKEWQDKQVIDS